MTFENAILKNFTAAGYYSGRNVSHAYNSKTAYHELPEFLKNFLREYGDSQVSYIPYKNPAFSVETISFDPEEVGFNDSQDFDEMTALYGFAVYPFAYSDEGTGYRIACDEQENVYMLGGPQDFLRGSSLQEGLQNIMARDYSSAKTFDEGSKTWI